MFHIPWGDKQWSVRVPDEVSAAYKWPYVQKFVVSGGSHVRAMLYVTELQWPRCGYTIGSLHQPVSAFASASASASSLSKPDVSSAFSMSDTLASSSHAEPFSRNRFQTQTPRASIPNKRGVESGTVIQNKQRIPLPTSNPSLPASPCAGNHGAKKRIQSQSQSSSKPKPRTCTEGWMESESTTHAISQVVRHV